MGFQRPGFGSARLRKNAICLVLACATLILVPLTGATAAEVIKSFHARIEIARNGDLTVTETITVNAEGREIQRGIFRDFPRTFVDDEGRSRRVGFTVLSVKRGGQDEPYQTSIHNDDSRVYIGDEDVFLDEGIYTYELKYKTDRQIRFFETHDEIYWNVTGNGWAFPIEEASAEVILPGTGTINATDYFTGFAGATDKNASAALEDNGKRARFATIAPLAKNQGLTIVASMAKGVIDPPNDSQVFWWFMRDFGHVLVALATFGLVSLYYLIAWFRVGRDPDGGTIVPRWDLPEGLSPALVSYIDRKGLAGKGRRAISAAILSLAVKGHLVIDEDSGSPTLQAKANRDSGQLPVGEAAVLGALPNAKRFHLARTNGRAVQEMDRAFSRAMEAEHRKIYYQHNTVLSVCGLVLSVLGLLTTAFFTVTGIFIILIMGIAALLVAAMMLPSFFIGRAALRAKSLTLKLLGVVLVGALTALVITGVGWVILSIAGDLDPVRHLAFIAAFVGIVGINALFYFLIGAPTRLGAEMTSAIEGLRIYLNLVEKDRMNLRGAPKMSPTHFETLLPFAVALGVEQRWSESFETWLASADAAGAGNRRYNPSWSRHDFATGGIGDRFGSFGTSMSSSLSSAMPVSSSSSGFSGGSSGGGGGGGGGGGW